MADSTPLPDPSELLVHGEWLRRLARSLVRDDAAAEDLVQDTWLSVLRFGLREGVPPRPWLSRILQNRMRSLERAETRRERRESEVAPSELLPSTEALSERAESGRLLLEAVLSLPDAQRQVLLLCYFEGLPVARIAPLIGTSEVAVRSRIARAVAALREELDERSDGDRARWLHALIPFTRARDGAFISMAAIDTFTLLGFKTMTGTSKGILAAAALLALGIGLIAFDVPRSFRQAERGSERVAAIDARESFHAEANDTGVVTTDDHAAPATRTPQAPQPTVGASEPEARPLFGRVVDAGTRAPVIGARVLVHDIEHLEDLAAGADLSALPAKWQLETDLRGEFGKELDGASVVALEVIRDGYVPRRLPIIVVGVDTEIELQPASRLVLEVRLDRNGDRALLEPFVGAACRLVLDGHSHSLRTIQHGTTDARGEVVFASRGRDAHVIVDRTNQPSFVKIYELEAGQDRLEVVLPPVGAVTGRVVDSSSKQPISGARLTELNRAELAANTDGDGLFRIPHEHTDNAIWIVTHPGYGTVYQRIFPQSSPEARVPDIELEVSAVIVGRVDGFEGQVQLSAMSKKSWFVHQRFRQHLWLTGAGPVQVTGVPPREELVLEARDGHGRIGIVEVRAAAPGETIDFGALMPTATGALHGQLAGLDPTLPAVVRVQIKSGDLVLRDLTRAVRDAEYQVKNLPLGRTEAWIEQEGSRGIVSSLDLVAGDTSLDLDLGGTIRGTVRDESGAGVRESAAILHSKVPGGHRRDSARSDAAGRFVCAGLDRAALYSVSVLLFGGLEADVQPEVIEDVKPGGPPLEFTVRPNAWTITGTVSSAILESVNVDLLQVEGRCERESVSATVRDDGTFSLSLPRLGPWNLELLALSVGGEELDIYSVPDVAEIRDASPGVPVEFRRK